MNNIIKVKKEDIKELYNSACQSWKDKVNEKFKNFMFDEVLEVEQSFLQEIRQACDAKQLKLFLRTFEDYFPNNLLNKKWTYKEVCKELNEIQLEDPYKQIKQLMKFFNQGWIPNIRDNNQRKYYPYFTTGSGGLGFYDSGCHVDYFFAFAGLFKDKETSDYIGQNFIHIYQNLADNQ